MNKINILTLAGLLLLPFALYQNYVGYTFISEITAFVAFMLVFIDNQKITSTFQHISLPIVTMVLAWLIEQVNSGFPYIGIGLLLGVGAMIGRMVFIRFFSYARFPYMEPVLTAIFVGLTMYQTLLSPQNWYYYFPAYVFIMLLIMHSYIILKNAHMLNRGIKNGYKGHIGIEAPDFLLPDQHGNGVQLSAYRKKRHVLLIFVRGDWCPYCHMIMRTYMRESYKFKQKNIMLIAIGPDSSDVNREMAKKLGLDYKVLTDDKMRIAWAYGIQLPDFSLPGATKHTEGMPLPASFLIDKSGKVVYTSRSSRVGEFLDPQLIFPIVEKLN